MEGNEDKISDVEQCIKKYESGEIKPNEVLDKIAGSRPWSLAFIDVLNDFYFKLYDGKDEKFNSMIELFGLNNMFCTIELIIKNNMERLMIEQKNENTVDSQSQIEDLKKVIHSNLQQKDQLFEKIQEKLRGLDLSFLPKDTIDQIFKEFAIVVNMGSNEQITEESGAFRAKIAESVKDGDVLKAVSPQPAATKGNGKVAQGDSFFEKVKRQEYLRRKYTHLQKDEPSNESINMAALKTIFIELLNEEFKISYNTQASIHIYSEKGKESDIVSRTIDAILANYEAAKGYAVRQELQRLIISDPEVKLIIQQGYENRFEHFLGIFKELKEQNPNSIEALNKELLFFLDLAIEMTGLPKEWLEERCIMLKQEWYKEFLSSANQDKILERLLTDKRAYEECASLFPLEQELKSDPRPRFTNDLSSAREKYELLQTSAEMQNLFGRERTESIAETFLTYILSKIIERLNLFYQRYLVIHKTIIAETASFERLTNKNPHNKFQTTQYVKFTQWNKELMHKLESITNEILEGEAANLATDKLTQFRHEKSLTEKMIESYETEKDRIKKEVPNIEQCAHSYTQIMSLIDDSEPYYQLLHSYKEKIREQLEYLIQNIKNKKILEYFQIRKKELDDLLSPSKIAAMQVELRSFFK